MLVLKPDDKFPGDCASLLGTESLQNGQAHAAVVMIRTRTGMSIAVKRFIGRILTLPSRKPTAQALKIFSIKKITTPVTET
jgi:hypothetical protein